jgi:deoxyribodipyrimidine photo-lyase
MPASCLPVDDPRATIRFKGGETEALAHLQQYFDHVKQASGQKNGRNSTPVTSNLSPWIALGCISMRQVYREVLKHEDSTHSNNPMILELLWRDYFRFMFKKHGQKFIAAKEDVDTDTLAANQDELFEKWKQGNTGVPLVDAIMHELNATGYISNYNRQVVAGFLVNTLKADWTKGAAYFEEKLIDYSPASNWGNWAFIAGINNDSRYVNIAKSAGLDAKSDFIATWLPELNDDKQLHVNAL